MFRSDVNTLLTSAQVQGHRIPAHSILQLPELTKVQWLRQGPLHRWRGMAKQGRLPTQLVQIRWQRVGDHRPKGRILN
jgi:hypothetical protein